MKAQAKTINLLLYDGNLDGVISIEDSYWNAGELYSAPREPVSDLLETDACKKYGVYLLLSSDMVYVGQSSDLSKRLNQHIIGKDWWESAVILTTKDDSLNHSDIDYIENILIERAQKAQKLDCENKKRGNPPKVDKFRKVYLGQYLDEALFLMQLIGINVFSDTRTSSRSSHSSKSKTAIIDTLDPKLKLSLGKRVKAEAIKFVKNSGISLEKNINYAVLQEGKNLWWINPNVTCLSKNWNLILNDTVNSEIIVLLIPANDLTLSSEKKKGLHARNDQPHRIDLKISVESLIDTVSRINFAKYEIKRIPY